MKMLTLVVAGVWLLADHAHADDPCVSMTKHAEAADRVLQSYGSSARVPRSAIEAAARDLAIAASAARECSDKDAKRRMRAVYDSLSDRLLAASDAASRQ